MKNINKLKYENIIFMLSICFSIQSMIHHIKLNGLYAELGIEIIMDILMCLGVKYVVWYFRKHTKEVLHYIANLVVE